MAVIRDGYKKTDAGVIPLDWEVDLLKNLVDFYNGKAHEKAVVENGDYIIINSKFVSTDGQVRKYADQCKFPLMEKDIVMVMSDVPNGKAIAKTFLVEENNKYTLNQRIGCFRNAKIDVEFLNYVINRNKYYLKFDDGVKQTNLRKSDVLGLAVQLPLACEQKQIAEILTSTDDHIEKLDGLITEYELFKKGMMQKLLTEGIGHTEFKDSEVGRIPKEWEVCTLAELGETYGGLSGVTKEDFGNGNPYIPYKNIFKNTKIDINYMDYVDLSGKKNQNEAKYGDIFFTTSSETPEEAGMSSVLLDEVEQTYLNSFCFGYRLHGFGKLRPEFARYLLRGSYFRKSISRIAQGSTRFNLSKGNVLKIAIPLPCVEEQLEIGNAISKVENRIRLFNQERSDFSEFKKSLMEQLLTGKVRVV